MFYVSSLSGQPFLTELEHLCFGSSLTCYFLSECTLFMVGLCSILENLQSQLSLNRGICLVLIPTVPVYDFSTADWQPRLCSCEWASVEAKIWRTAIERDIFIVSCLCSFFLVSPVACQLWGLEHRII